MFEKFDWRAKVIAIATQEGSSREVAAALGVGKSYVAECKRIHKYIDRPEIISCTSHADADLASRRLALIEGNDPLKDLQEATYTLNSSVKTYYPNRVLRSIPEKSFHVAFANDSDMLEVNKDYLHRALVNNAFLYVFTTFKEYIGIWEYMQKESMFTVLKVPLVWADMGKRSYNHGRYHDDDTRLVLVCIKGVPTLLDRTSNFYSGSGDSGYDYFVAGIINRSVVNTAGSKVLLINHKYEVQPPLSWFKLEFKRTR